MQRSGGDREELGRSRTWGVDTDVEALIKLWFSGLWCLTRILRMASDKVVLYDREGKAPEDSLICFRGFKLIFFPWGQIEKKTWSVTQGPAGKAARLFSAIPHPPRCVSHSFKDTPPPAIPSYFEFPESSTIKHSLLHAFSAWKLFLLWLKGKYSLFFKT